MVDTVFVGGRMVEMVLNNKGLQVGDMDIGPDVATSSVEPRNEE